MQHKKVFWFNVALLSAIIFSVPAWAQTMSGDKEAPGTQPAPGISEEKMPGISQQSGAVTDLSANEVRDLQQALKDKGHFSGEVDGNWGPETQAALRAFQESSGLEATGELDAETRAKLELEASGSETPSGSGLESGSPITPEAPMTPQSAPEGPGSSIR